MSPDCVHFTVLEKRERGPRAATGSPRQEEITCGGGGGGGGGKNTR